jgi:hypothetical protein
MANDNASDLVELALNEAITQLDGYEDGDLLVEWVLVAYTTNPDKESASAYPMLYSNGELPTYRARGLLATGLKMLDFVQEE